MSTQIAANSPNYFSVLHGHQYMNLVTFRKTGVGVKTPVWFALNGNRLLMYTLGTSGKVKRIRNNPRVQVGPSDARGEPLGTAVEARAHFLQGEEVKTAEKLLGKKYGLLYTLLNLQRKLSGAKIARVFIEITPSDQAIGNRLTD
jgi:PPOX class probable F420-dependent enzyme